MTDFLSAVPLIALAISLCALVVSTFSLLQSRKTALLSMRREVIEHLRTALSDVQIHGAINHETVASIREAYQLSSLVFGRKITQTLEEAFTLAFRLSHTREDRWNDKHYGDREVLLKHLADAFAETKARASIS